MITEGSLVRLKSGGPLMRVVDVTINGSLLWCEWGKNEHAIFYASSVDVIEIVFNFRRL